MYIDKREKEVIVLLNGNTTPCFNSPYPAGKNPQKLLNDLSELKQVSKSDLKSFLSQDHTSFSVLSVSTKHIESTDRISVTLSKNSAQSFYLGKTKKTATANSPKPDKLPDDCLHDAHNCTYFAFFNSKEKKLYTRFLDKIEANFEGTAATQPGLFLTLTFNTTHDDYHSWTTNWDPTDTCWNTLNGKQAWLKYWAQKIFHDQEAELSKTHIHKVKDQVQQHAVATRYLQIFLRRIRRLWKPPHWKWCLIAELQKNGVWHYHFLSTPIVPYSHKCTLDKNFKSCWNCRAYISQLWPYGRVESRSPGKKSISKYLAKYLSKSFHLRSLYQQHGLKENHKTYRFFKNLYDYEQKSVLLIGKHRLDAQTGQHLPKNQQIFRRYDYQTQQTSYWYRTNEKLIGHVAQPVLIKKNYRLGTRSLNPLNLLKLASKHDKKEAYFFKKPSPPTLHHDFQDFLITRLLLLCKSAEFTHIPLEQEHVPKENNNCNQLIYTHFQTKPVLHFQFLPEQAPVVRQFIDNLDNYTAEYDMEEAQNFYFYPISHDTKHEITKKLNGACGCEIRARNQYLNNWQLNYPSDQWRRAPG